MIMRGQKEGNRHTVAAVYNPPAVIDRRYSYDFPKERAQFLEDRLDA